MGVGENRAERGYAFSRAAVAYTDWLLGSDHYMDSTTDAALLDKA
jgi:hypothetical protein